MNSQAKQKWFAIFGDGAGWVQLTMNTILGVIIALSIGAFTFKFVVSAMKAKTSEDDEERARIRKGNVKNLFAIGGIFAFATVAFLVLNIIPAPSKPDTNNFFGVFKGAQKDAQKYFDLTILGLTSLAVLIFLIITPIRLINYMNADDDGKVKITKTILSSIKWLILILIILFILNVLLNVLPSPTKI